MGRGTRENSTTGSGVAAAVRIAAAGPALRGGAPVKIPVACSGHRVIDVTPGVIDAASATVFTQGQCHAMALALHDATGWQLKGLYDDDGDYAHYYVKTPEGKALDITGLHDEDEFIDGWGCDDEDLYRSQVKDAGASGGMREPDLTAAATFVPAVMEYHAGKRPNYLDVSDEDALESLGEAVEERLADVLRVVESHGSHVNVVPGRRDEAALKLFRGVQSTSIARSLAMNKVGLRLAAVLDEHGTMVHACAETSDRRAVNIDGIHDPQDLVKGYKGARYVSVSYRDLDRLTDNAEWPEPDDTAADTFTGSLIAQLAQS